MTALVMLLGIVVLDELPTGYTYVSDDSGGNYNPANGAWNVGTLPAENNAALNISVQVNPSGNYSNSAEVLAVVQLDPDSHSGQQ